MEAFTIVDVGVGMLLAIVAFVYVSRNRAKVRAEHLVWVSLRPRLVGTVQKLKKIEGEGTTYIPLIVYTLPNGQRYAIDGEESNFPEPGVGTEVDIAYEPAMPSTARVVSPASLFEDTPAGDVIGFAVVTLVGTLLTTFIRAVIEYLR